MSPPQAVPCGGSGFPPYSATLVHKLLAAGMIVLGKTHTVEFAYGAWGTNQHMGTPWNPWDMKVQRTPGGSSSGSAVAVAARMAPCAIGTDTGGSVRVPAAWCGITGLKTTIGRISTHGVLPLAAHSGHAGTAGAQRGGLRAVADAVAGAGCAAIPLTAHLPPSDADARLAPGRERLAAGAPAGCRTRRASMPKCWRLMTAR